ncbi:alpha-amylase family glycosyl hydrolase [Engelhardtia mirabilis]|uniref:Alpha-amylase 2 n=1 Tax=Engelhardtia mirabilis TaxID=2528011 RepID=A0A518BMY4_9BACT|nr:Alpha-amylase 2 [Planctomycetes bacterium Pla133]QDV02661.1 Alpha-amylase 2 [Planctomycetes bacterium Pla86]
MNTPDRTLYEVNLRQFSPEGTFDAFREHLPRLAELGVGILWLMPIHPIGVLHRKGSLGSYYAATDYMAVNPEFGSEDDLRELVDAAHGLGMAVILDWVANHTAWDHVWTRSHPERFRAGPEGGFVPPNPDWTDVIGLDYDEPSTRRAMTDAMLHWVRACRIDGFRCDVAELVPADFWRAAIAELRAERPQFMLAEGEREWLYEAGFDATYGWNFAASIEAAAAGGRAAVVRDHVERDRARLAEAGVGAFRMHFTTNHDWNSWETLAVDRFGPAWELATVLTFTLPGMPLIYSGQEAGLDQRLDFFEKDLITWRADPAADLYRRLCALKRSEPALGHGAGEGTLEFIELEGARAVLAFRRSSGSSEVLVLVNFSADRSPIDASATPEGSHYVDLHGFPAGVPKWLDAWEAVVLRRVR